MQPSLNDTAQAEEPKEKPNFFTDTKNLFQSYLGDRFALIKLQAVEKVSTITAAVISGVIIAVLGLFFLIALTVMLGFLFGEIVNSIWLGFAIVAGIYLLLILIVAFFGKKLFGNAITHKMIQSFLKKK